MGQKAIMTQNIPTSHWGRLASTVAQIDIWKKDEKATYGNEKWNFGSFMVYSTEAKHSTDL